MSIGTTLFVYWSAVAFVRFPACFSCVLPAGLYLQVEASALYGVGTDFRVGYCNVGWMD
jgi:hypothetical protein